MVKSVKISAMPTSTMLGGVCWVPMAVRRKENTTMYRVKEVIKTTKEGNSASTVVSSRISSVCTAPPFTLIIASVGMVPHLFSSVFFSRSFWSRAPKSGAFRFWEASEGGICHWAPSSAVSSVRSVRRSAELPKRR